MYTVVYIKLQRIVSRVASKRLVRPSVVKYAVGFDEDVSSSILGRPRLFPFPHGWCGKGESNDHLLGVCRYGDPMPSILLHVA